MTPVIWLFARPRNWRFLNCPNSGGISPCRLFSLRFEQKQDVVIQSTGIIPVRLFIDKDIAVRLGSVASHNGTEQVKLFTAT